MGEFINKQNTRQYVEDWGTFKEDTFVEENSGRGEQE